MYPSPTAAPPTTAERVDSTRTFADVEAALLQATPGRDLVTGLETAREELAAAQAKVEALEQAGMDLGKILTMRALKETYGMQVQAHSIEPSNPHDPLMFTAALDSSTLRGDPGETDLGDVYLIGASARIHLSRQAFDQARQVPEGAFYGCTRAELVQYHDLAKAEHERANTRSAAVDTAVHMAEKALQRLTLQLARDIIDQELVPTHGEPTAINFVEPTLVQVVYKNTDIGDAEGKARQVLESRIFTIPISEADLDQATLDVALLASPEPEGELAEAIADFRAGIGNDSANGAPEEGASA